MVLKCPTKTRHVSTSNNSHRTKSSLTRNLGRPNQRMIYGMVPLNANGGRGVQGVGFVREE